MLKILAIRIKIRTFAYLHISHLHPARAGHI